MTETGNRFKPYLPLILALVMAGGILLGLRLGGEGGGMMPFSRNYNKINDILNYVQGNYVDTVNREKLTEAAINGMLESLDPHSSYIPASDFHDVTDPLKGNFEGIGVQFRLVKDTVVIINTIPGGPSEKAGVHSGDRIVKVDGTTIAGRKITDKDVMKKLKGPKGTKVKVEVLRAGFKSLLSFNITRDIIPTWSIDASYIAEPGIGYIKLSKFSATTSNEVIAALKDLKNQGMKNLILDLRGNGGGYLQAAILLADEFLPDKAMIVYTMGSKRKKEVAYASGHGQFEKGGLAILIDEGTASASEIVSGAIQDNDRGFIVGRRSFGKGLVQEEIDLKDGSAIRLTVARYYTPSGRCIQKPYTKGVTEYMHESMDRFTDGEVEHPDSIRFADSLKFKTKNGRIVYGGGGIMPDTYIQLKRDDKNIYMNKLLNSNTLYQYTFDYTDKNRTALSRFKTWQEFAKGFVVTPAMISEFISYADKNSIPRDPKALEANTPEISQWIKALIARTLFDDKGFYPIYNQTDDTFKKAISLLKGK